MLAEVALLLTWLVVIPYIVMFPPHRFWRLRAKLHAMRDRSIIRSLTVKPKWADKRTGVTNVPASSKAVVVLVNPTSGGQLGARLLLNLRELLHPSQVVDVTVERPESVFRRFQGKNIRIVVCGGDGTVGWAMNAATESQQRWPIAILPLGTGNDLARSIGWGGGATAETVTKPALSVFLGRVGRARTRLLDRWTVDVTDLATGAVRSFLMNNYVSVGIDAEIGLKFHNERKDHPERFSSQQKNVFKYALYGFEGAFEGVPLGETVTMLVGKDRRPLPINPHWKGLVVNNLPCYQGGKDFWGTADGDEFRPVDIADQHLEVMGLSGTLHIGLVHVSLDHALRLAQPDEVLLRCESSICIQIDGEPFDHPPCTVKVVFAGTYPVLYWDDTFVRDSAVEEEFSD